MAEINCEACEKLRQEEPQLLVNGFDDDMCTSLQNDTGLDSAYGNNDCTDLNAMNDCLIGNMEEDIELYEVCDWKTFMKSFIPNIWTLYKAIICAICGLWTNVHSLWAEVQKLWADIQRIWDKFTEVIADYTDKINNVNQSVTIINNQVATMPKDILFADVKKVQTIQSGYPQGHVNRVDIDATRSDGYVPVGIVGWNLSNYGSSTGVRLCYPFKVKLMGNAVSIQINNTGSDSARLEVEATVLYVKS